MVRAAILALALALPASAQEGGVTLDLNRLDDSGGTCRLTFVADNALAPLSSMVVETVLFDRAGRVAALMLFDFGALPMERRRVRQFDVAGLACADVTQVLVNGVSACSGDTVDAAACAAALVVTGSVDGLEVAQ